MQNSTQFRISKLFILLIFLSSFFLNAQEKAVDIVSLYQNYTSDAREVVYVHLNKSAYFKGEAIGFTAYTLDKKDKRPSKVTTNLYVSIEDENNNILKQKLLKVENGVAANIIEIDSSFNSGNYTFKAYTNWMRNFNEQNYFVASVKIIDPKIDEHIETASIENSIDAQFLPESGHLLEGVINKVGVVLKDSKGYGIPNASGKVTDKNGTLITEFRVNHLGIGNFPLLAEATNSYLVDINYKNKAHKFNLGQKVEPRGVVMSLASHRDKAILQINTNKTSLEYLENKPYKLVLHNGDKIDALEVVFDKNLSIIKVFDLNAIPTGINVFTLFNEDNKPVTERIFFNYNGLRILESSNVAAIKETDSITIKLKFKDIVANSFNNLSVSVLPKETESYKTHHNMVSYTYLQPYVKGNIEQAKYYFNDVTTEKKMHLDHLLITQGWSSYDWKYIFNQKPAKKAYDFEQGITLKANINAESKALEAAYMVHTTNDTIPHFFYIENTGVKHFYIDSLFPGESEQIFMSKFEENGRIIPAGLYLQAFPSHIPKINLTSDVLFPKNNYNIKVNLTNNVIAFDNLDQVQKLEEVLVTTVLSKKELRIKELTKQFNGRATIVDEEELKKHMYLSNFLSKKGYNAVEDYRTGTLMVKSKSEFIPPPNVILNGYPANRIDLFMLPLEEVDYIMIHKPPYGRGTIRIKSHFGSRRENNRKKTQEFKFPLSFNSGKKFYVPKYRYYNDDLFKGYGTIDWEPKLTTDASRDVTLKIAQPEVPITLFIEGIANDGSFVLEEKSISVN